MKKVIYMCFVWHFLILMGYAQNNIIMSPPSGGGDSLIAYKDEASNYIKDKTKIDYSSSQAYDGNNNTAWCVSDGGIGEWIKFYFKESSHPNYHGIMNVYRIEIINGLAANKKLYFANNRIKKMQVEFSGGEKRIINLKDGCLDYQVFTFNIKAYWVQLKILEIYRGNKYNDTCISEIDFRTWTHPDDMTSEQRKRLGY